MTKNRLIYIGIIMMLLSLDAFAQPFRIFGKVVDDSTNTPIPFASVAISGLNLGTSTNINGEFLIKVDSLPSGLIFSHVSYEKMEIEVYSNDYVTVSLKPRKMILEELVIEDKERGEFPYNLMIQALSKAIKNSRDWKYGLAYYRQTSMNGDDYSELYEIFYDTRYSSQGIVDWDIQEGRYALKTGSEANDFVYNKNFTLLSRMLTLYQPETDDFVMPVNERVRELYHLKINELLDMDGRKVAVVNFIPKEGVYIPAMKGNIYIDIDSYDIVKLEGQFETNDLDFIQLTNPQGSWKNFLLNIEVAYNPREDDMYLDYIHMSQSFDYYVADTLINRIETNSFLTYYEYYEPEKFKRLGGRLLRFRRSDREILDRIGYNKRFWGENPIVLRTPVEEEIIAAFEEDNAFGSIYLNERQQIQLDKDKLMDDPFIQQLTIDLRNTKITSMGEKIYLHIDKPIYGTGETLWFNAYIVNIGTLILSDLSGVLYVDFLSSEGEILTHKRLMVTSGLCEGNIDIPKDLKSGDYVVRAYTNWMKNYDPDFFFEKYVPVYNAKEDLYQKNSPKSEISDFEVQFLPEGGHLVHNIPSQIAFKALDSNGNGIDIRGKVSGPDGKTIVELETRHDGMGSFFINPQYNTPYKAVVKYGRMEKEILLPEVALDGYVVTVNNLKDRNLQVHIKNSPGLDNTDLYVVAQSRGTIFHREKITVKRGGEIVSLPKSKFPEGILHLTIFNMKYVPVLERLVFINNEDEISAGLETDKEALNPREKITMKLEVKDQYGKAVRNTSFSMAVTDADHMFKKDTRETIHSYLLFTSDLKGTISDPGYYFLEDDRDTRIALDLVMLTHGWRRFTWEKVRDNKIGEVTYPHENGINLKGKAISKSNKPVSNAFLRFVPLSNDFFGLWEVTTGQEGRFELNGLIIPDSTAVVAKSVDDKGKSENVKLDLDEMDMIPPFTLRDRPTPSATPDDDVLDYIDYHGIRQQEYALYDVQEKIVLKEIVIEDTEIRKESIHGEPDNVIVMDEFLSTYTDIFQVLQGRVPGVQVFGDGMNAQVRIRGITSFTGSNTPLFLIDGTPISDPTPTTSAADTTAGGSVPSFSMVNSALMSIPPRDVDRIEILKGPSAAIYGVRGANGVIAIYTRRGLSAGSLDDRDIREDLLYLPGFHVVKEFYSPDYEIKEEEHAKPDLRTTLYWDPSVKTNNLGYAEITFYNSDKGKKLQVDLQGITDYGDPVQYTSFIGEQDIK